MKCHTLAKACQVSVIIGCFRPLSETCYIEYIASSYWFSVQVIKSVKSLFSVNDKLVCRNLLLNDKLVD